MKRFVIVAVVLTLVGVFSYQLLPPPAAGRVAAKQLARVERFSFGAIGYSGSMPEREALFFSILSSRHSDRLFRELFEEGTTEARVYALAGLHLTDRQSFRTCAARFARESSRVQTQGGCIASDCTSAQAIEIIEQGAIE